MHASFRLHEPMLFRGPMEFSPYVRGPKTIASSLILPTPSTIAGALATLCLDTQKASPPRAVEWEEEVVEVIGLDQARLKGPYLIVEGGGGEEVYTQFTDHLAKFEEVVRALQSLDQDLRDALMVKKKKLKELLEENNVNFYQPTFSETVGTRLERGYKRVMERGGLYTVQMVDYSTLHSSKRGMIIGKAFDNLSVAIDICGRSKISDLERRESVLRFGGEGRLSHLIIKEGEPVTSRVKELLAGFERGEAYLYLITHSLYKSGKDHAKVHEVCRGGYVTPTIWRRLEGVLRGISPSIEPKYMIGECTIFGAGYSISGEVRKPIYSALSPGTIIKVEGTKEGLFSLYKEGVSEAGSEIGYGTVIPIPTQC
jgi:CRISPR-associated protein Cmr3